MRHCLRATLLVNCEVPVNARNPLPVPPHPTEAAVKRDCIFRGECCSRRGQHRGEGWWRVGRGRSLKGERNGLMRNNLETVMSSGAVVTTPVPPSVSTSKITPNPHPYAIKTTSTGLLTRSNSSTQNIHVSRHYYVPPSPTAKRPDETVHSPQTSPSSRRTHRLSRSLSGVDSFESPNKRPLPTPPPHPSTLPSYSPLAEPEQWVTPKRPKRAETLPSTTPDLDVTPVKLEDLPTNPKLWTPSQLSSYLTTALRIRSGEVMSLPLPVARDIATFVKGSRINGRLFLRLCEQDLDQSVPQ